MFYTQSGKAILWDALNCGARQGASSGVAAEAESHYFRAALLSFSIRDDTHCEVSCHPGSYLEDNPQGNTAERERFAEEL